MAFNEKKATEVAAFLLKMRGGRMSYLKLIKLLYLADREALRRWGFSVTNDRHVSMPHGPVLSGVLNLMVEDTEKPFWSRYISAPMGQYEIQLLQDCPTDKLSRAEERLLTEIFQQYGQMSRWQLRDYTHGLPEWHDPQGSSRPISIADILEAQGISKEDIEAITQDMEQAEKAERLLGEAV